MPERINVFANVVDLRPLGRTKAKGAFASESALHSFDGDKPNSVGPESVRGLMIIHLAAIARSAQQPFGGHRPPLQSPWCDDTRGFLTGRLPFLCFVLHRMGFFMPRESLRER